MNYTADEIIIKAEEVRQCLLAGIAALDDSEVLEHVALYALDCPIYAWEPAALASAALAEKHALEQARNAASDPLAKKVSLPLPPGSSAGGGVGGVSLPPPPPSWGFA